MKKGIYIILSFFLLIAVPLHSQVTPNIYKQADRQQMNNWVDSLMANMDLDEKIGQLFMLVVDPNPNPGAVKIISSHIQNYHIGGILFSRGKPVNQVISTNTYQKAADVPLMIALDGEWGLSMRLSSTTPFPKTMTLGAIQDKSLLESYGEEVARQCRDMGIHINFAPVLDVSSETTRSSVGVRSFGDNPQRVSQHANAYAHGLEKGGIMAVAKHFPGHGYAEGDSHDVTARINLSRQMLEEKNLYPFRSYINEGFSGIMNGHFSIPALDNESQLPTSLSPVVMTALLKDDMGFSGLVFTDALVMRGAKAEGKYTNVCVQALLAGNDVLVSPPKIQEDFYAVKSAVARGIIPEEMINDKCRKILEYKFIFGLNKYKPIVEENLLKRINTPYAEQLATRLYEESITLLKNKGDALPLKKDSPLRVAVLAIGTPVRNNCLMSSFADYYVLKEDATDQDLLAVKEHLKDADVVVFCVYTNRGLSQKILNLIIGRNKCILCVFQSPFGLLQLKPLIDRVDAVLLAYENTSITHESVLTVLQGSVSAKGMLPVSINGISSGGARKND